MKVKANHLAIAIIGIISPILFFKKSLKKKRKTVEVDDNYTEAYYWGIGA